MSSIRCTQKFSLEVCETFSEAELPATSQRMVRENQFGATVTASADSAPAASKAWSAKLTGSQTLQLTALARMLGTVNALGLALRAILINNLSTTATVSIGPAETNGYAINAGGPKTIGPSGRYQEWFAAGLQDVDATHNTLAITVTPAGTGTEVLDYQIQLVFG